MSNPNDANSFWTCDFFNAYFNNDDEMHYGDNEFDEEYSYLDEKQFNGSYNWDDPFFNCEVEMHRFCNDPGHGYLNPNHDSLHCRDDTDYDWSDTNSDSNCDSEEKFDYVNGLVGEMASYVQRGPMRTSILIGNGYMDEVRDGNPQPCFEMFRMSLRLFYHLVDELKQHGYLKERKGCIYVQESVAMFLYVIGHNTRMWCIANRFQHSTEMVSHKIQRVILAVHS